MGKEIIIRTPLITNLNDSDENVQFTADLFSQYKSIRRVGIMACHEYGSTKYKQLGVSYKLCDLPTNLERAKEVKRIFEQKGLSVQLGG